MELVGFIQFISSPNILEIIVGISFLITGIVIIYKRESFESHDVTSTIPIFLPATEGTGSIVLGSIISIIGIILVLASLFIKQSF